MVHARAVAQVSEGTILDNSPPQRPVSPQNPSNSPAADAATPGDGDEFEEGDIVLQRERWFYGQRAYPLGYIPAGARINALSQLDHMLASRQRLRKQLGLSDEKMPDAFGTTWKVIGPKPISVPSGRPPFLGTLQSAGRVSALAVDPKDPSIVYLGAAEGGVWKTADGGIHWKPLTDQQASLAVGSIAIDASPSSCDEHKCNTIYVGTGEENDGYYSYYGAGILKSVDGGNTWAQIKGPFTGEYGANRKAGGAYIGSLAVNPMNRDFLLAGVEFFREQDRSGIYRSMDGGETWSLVLPGAYGTAVMFDPQAENVVYAALGTFAGNANNGVYESWDEGDPGSWTLLNGAGDVLPRGTSVGRIAMAISPVKPHPLYVSVAKPNTRDGGALLGFWSSTGSSTNGVVTWRKEPMGDLPLLNAYCHTQCNYDNTVAAPPVFGNRVVLVGGQFNANTSQTRGILLMGRGMPGVGFTWRDISAGGNGINLHSDLHALAFSGDGRKLYVGTDGGVWSTSDGTKYTNLNETLAITQYYPGFSISPNLDFSLGGTQDNGVTRYTGGLSWDYATCGDGGWTVISSINPSNVFVSCAATGDPRVRCGVFNIQRSTQAGRFGTWTCANRGITDNRVNPIPPLVAAPSDNGTALYFGAVRVWQNLNRGTGNWTAISGVLTGGMGTISTVFAKRNTAYAGTTDGKVWKTTNGLGNWVEVDAGLPNRAVTQVFTNHPTGRYAFVTYSGFSGFGGDRAGHVFETQNSGKDWSDVSGDPNVSPLPNTPVNDIVKDPDLCGTYYVATDLGVFYTADYGERWQSLVSGLPRVAVMSLAGYQRTLRAATYGRSVWQLSVPSNFPSGIKLLPTTVDFGTIKIGNTKSMVVTLTNACDYSSFGRPLSVRGIAVYSSEAEQNIFTATNNCVGTLGVGDSCKITVSFTAKEAGVPSAMLFVGDNGLGSPRGVYLTAVVVEDPQ
jgi:photosystem II stability/assembly factor-like uncharacterized protein